MKISEPTALAGQGLSHALAQRGGRHQKWMPKPPSTLRVGAYVFASTGKAGRITDARASHALALRSAGIGHLTFHGLRRSFSLLGEAAGAPAGAIAQIMGHKPSATAEGYRPRSIDALRPFAQRIEAYILELANVQFEAPQEAARLRIVK